MAHLYSSGNDIWHHVGNINIKKFPTSLIWHTVDKLPSTSLISNQDGQVLCWLQIMGVKSNEPELAKLGKTDLCTDDVVDDDVT